MSNKKSFLLLMTDPISQRDRVRKNKALVPWKLHTVKEIMVQILDLRLWSQTSKQSKDCELILKRRLTNARKERISVTLYWIYEDHATECYWITFKKVKLIRAQGGCLGTKSRRKTWQAAISCGKEQISNDPQISEWGNPAEKTSVIHTPIHNVWRGTRGTETSKYPEEEKETSISWVAASERERA